MAGEKRSSSTADSTKISGYRNQCAICHGALEAIVNTDTGAVALTFVPACEG